MTDIELLNELRNIDILLNFGQEEELEALEIIRRYREQILRG